MKVYIASGWFSKEAMEDVENIKEILNALNFKYFSPKDANLAGPGDPPHLLKKTFSTNLLEVQQANLIVCNTRDKDMGSIFEAGYAYYRRIPIIYYWAGGKGDFNLMLAQSGIAVATNRLELMAYLANYRQDENWKKPYKGRIE